MNSKQFIHSIRRLGRKRGLAVSLDKDRGKGSHAVIYFGSRRTTLPTHRGDIGKGLLGKLCKQLGITRDDLK